MKGFWDERYKNHLNGFHAMKVWEEEIGLDEGTFHQGRAKVIRVVATL